MQFIPAVRPHAILKPKGWWRLEAMGDNATVAVHINRLREKLEMDPSNPHYIETVWGAGYRFRG